MIDSPGKEKDFAIETQKNRSVKRDPDFTFEFSALERGKTGESTLLYTSILPSP